MANTTEQALNKAREALGLMLEQFTKVPSTLRDSEARCKAHDAIAAVDAALAQPSQEPETGEFISVAVRLPKAGQRIQGLSRSGAWIETFDPNEPLGHMTHWRAVDDDANDATEQPAGSDKCKHFYSGAPDTGYTCVLCGQPKETATVEIDFHSEEDNCEGWELLAMALAEEEHCDIHQLIWTCGPTPEPWGEVWQKYEDEAKRMIKMVRMHTHPQPSAPVAQDVQAMMFEVYEYARISDGIDAATFEQRDNQKRKMMAQANKIRALLSTAPQVEQVEAKEGWKPIETAPKDGTYILVGSKRGSWVAKYKPVYTSGYRPENPWASMMLNHDHIGGQWPNPTHWMPLPAAPSSQKEGERG